MADLETHINQAAHNEMCAQHLLTTQFKDWAITAAFYAAVHLAEASFVYSGITATSDMSDPKRHAYRKSKVNDLSKPAFRNYSRLMDASYDVRYLAGSKSFVIASQYYSQAVVEELVLTKLPAVRTELEKAIGISLKKKPRK